jgi:membrane-bound lytic murein transglycosylase A
MPPPPVRAGRRLARLLPLLAGLLLPWLAPWPAAGQPPLPPPEPPRPVGFEALPDWPGDDLPAALAPLLRGCEALRARWPADRPLGTGPGAAFRPGNWAGACAEAEALAETLPAAPDARMAALREFLERRFRPVAMGTGLLTGYYEPELRGAEAPGGPYRVPLLGPPPGLAPEDIGPPPPLPDRAAIEAGALAGLGLEMAWVDSAADAFFLHIQGSGRLRLEDGRVLRLGFAGKNGHPYRSIGRVLIEAGEIPREAMSMQALRGWLDAAPPEAAAALLRSNPSYVFFRPLPGLAAEEGPLGAMGVPLTPGRSLAVDPAHIPYGAPVYVAARDPLDGAPLRRLMLAQDTGGAIRGPARGDVFWGWGDLAGTRAGLMRETAEVFVLLPRDAVP